MFGLNKNHFQRQKLKRLAMVLLLVGGTFGIFTAGLKWRIGKTYSRRIYRAINDLPNESESRIAIVFGAGVWPNGEPTPVLYDRIATGAELYRSGKVRKLLLT